MITLAAAMASLLVTVFDRRIAIPVVVVELVLGIVIGPEVLGLAQPDDFVEFFASLGLGLLFFFAGYEIDFERIRGVSLRLAGWGWLLSLALAYSVGGVLAWAGVVLSLLYTGSAMATTAIGTLIPILSNARARCVRGSAPTCSGRRGRRVGPILLITIALSTSHPIEEAFVLVAFVILAVGAALLAVRSLPLGWSALERTIESSSQLAVRLAVVLVFALVALATDLGLDLLLGGFAAGIIVRLALRDREVSIFESKLTAIGYGFLIPFFFILSGMKFNLDALTSSASGALKLPLFLALFLVVRGVPALLLYRNELDARDRLSLAFFSSTQLPLVVAITTLAIAADEMRSSTAAALVGAAILSTLIFPLIALRLRAGRAETDIDETVERERISQGFDQGRPRPDRLEAGFASGPRLLSSHASGRLA